MNDKYIDDGDVVLNEFEVIVDGERLTEETAEALGLETAGRIGRPALPDAERASVHLAFRVTPPVADRVDELARTTGRRRSDVLRDAVEAYLAG